MSITCQCLSDDLHRRICRAFQIAAYSSVGATIVGSAFSLLSVIIQVWIQTGATPDIDDSLGILGVIHNIGAFLLVQSSFAGAIIIPLALIIGFPIIFLSLREMTYVRWILYVVLGCLFALIMSTVMVSYPIYWPVNYFMPVIYGTCFSTALVLFENY